MTVAAVQYTRKENKDVSDNCKQRFGSVINKRIQKEVFDRPKIETRDLDFVPHDACCDLNAQKE